LNVRSVFPVRGKPRGNLGRNISVSISKEVTGRGCSFTN
jgi:hypothetical protein